MQTSVFMGNCSCGKLYSGGLQTQYGHNSMYHSINNSNEHSLGRYVPSNTIGITSSLGGRKLNTSLPSGGFVWGIH